MYIFINMLDKLLNCQLHPSRDKYSFLPVSTSYEDELLK